MLTTSIDIYNGLGIGHIPHTKSARNLSRHLPCTCRSKAEPSYDFSDTTPPRTLSMLPTYLGMSECYSTNFR